MHEKKKYYTIIWYVVILCFIYHCVIFYYYNNDPLIRLYVHIMNIIISIIQLRPYRSTDKLYADEIYLHNAIPCLNIKRPIEDYLL